MVEPDKVIDELEKYIAEADRLSELHLEEGSGEANRLYQKIRNFLQAVNKEKSKEFDRIIGIGTVVHKTDDREQEIYIKRLKNVKNFLLAFKEKIEQRK
ncbi:hypothetical protein [Candidatus Borrarchaeum sp.]|uniref:hypothetical protein n=1 Tax=Candidatus Borrarchaeum sp. TaxID=2846742 RepID=UPI0025808C46|nr:hypothetical protein [Candidatus Borrarchaeum sp.]